MRAVNTLLTRGLRDDRSWEDRRGRHILMTRLIQREWPGPDAAAQTHEAENGLGIGGGPYYFYVLRAEASHGFVVFVLSEADDVAWPPAARGATPFDSGGWWLDKIHTEPRLDPAARQTAFQAADVLLRDWKGAFEQYIDANYSKVDEYIEGRAPISRYRLPQTEAAILRGPPNTPKAWTWEVRIPHRLIARHLTPKAIFITERVRRAYVQWLWRESPLLPSAARRIRRWISNHAIVPDHNETVVGAAQKWMAVEAAGG